jgi:hypothetical protein
MLRFLFQSINSIYTNLLIVYGLLFPESSGASNLSPTDATRNSKLHPPEKKEHAEVLEGYENATEVPCWNIPVLGLLETNNSA